jgi:predicted RNase H-like HicB family nuclease
MKYLNYSVIFRAEPEGGYTAIVPALPGCISYGKTIEKAREMIQDAISGYIKSLRKHGEVVPTEHSSSLVSQVSIAYS